MLEREEIRLAYADGAFRVRSFDCTLPVAPYSYGLVLGTEIDALLEALGPESEDATEFLSILTAIRHLPQDRVADPALHRRFFDINDLAAIRMEDSVVFERVHALVFELLARGAIDGLRIDHVDGLYDPGDYLERLQARAWEARPLLGGPSAIRCRGKDSRRRRGAAAMAYRGDDRL